MNDDGGSSVNDPPHSRPMPAPSVISEVLAQSHGGQDRSAQRMKGGHRSAAGREPAIEGLLALPRIGDPYQAYAPLVGHMLPTLWLLPGDGTRRAFPYSGRVGGPDLVESPAGMAIVLRFADVAPREVVLAGRHLDELLLYLGYHAVAWVRALPPGKMIPDRAMPVVTGIAIRTWKPEEDGG